MTDVREIIARAYIESTGPKSDLELADSILCALTAAGYEVKKVSKDTGSK